MSFRNYGEFLQCSASESWRSSASESQAQRAGAAAVLSPLSGHLSPLRRGEVAPNGGAARQGLGELR
jgi:hypothetical protein